MSGNQLAVLHTSSVAVAHLKAYFDPAQEH